jgi:hypothetical protein
MLKRACASCEVALPRLVHDFYSTGSLLRACGAQAHLDKTRNSLVDENSSLVSSIEVESGYYS